MSDLPIACTLSPGERRGRATELLPELLTRAESYERLDEGLRLRFTASSETLLAITRVLDTERQCCQFFRFRLTIEPGLGPILLDVQGPTGTTGFLTDLMRRPLRQLLYRRRRLSRSPGHPCKKLEVLCA